MADPRAMPFSAPAEAAPPRVLGAARRAFADTVRGAVRIRPVHDSWNDERLLRMLAYRVEGVSLLLTCRVGPGGVWLAGGFLGPSRARLVLQRPARPSVRVDPASDLRIPVTRVPRGLASFAAECEHAGAWTAWRSDWLRL